MGNFFHERKKGRKKKKLSRAVEESRDANIVKLFEEEKTKGTTE